MKKITFAFILAITFSQAKAQTPDSVRIFLDSALNILQHNSIYTDKVNWKIVRDSTYLLAKDAKNYNDTRSALQFAFNSLGDKHGWLVLDDQEYRNPNFKPDTSRISDNIKYVASKGPKLYNGIIDNKFAYISIPFFGGQTAEAMANFAQRIQDSLCKNVTTETKGFIIDLRLNAGGNMFPMYAGISNIYGDGLVSETKDNKGNTTGKSSIKGNGILINDSIFTALKNNCGDFSKYPVAVLIGPVTGSAGECLAAGLHARSNTILIGEVTAGYTTGNLGFLLPGTNNGIVIGVDVLRDKTGKEYLENVKPDVEIIGDDFFGQANDKKIQAAVKWLNEKMQ
ncbi:hypothetical protein FRZ67_20065 [Panacibacter ginsenosidivorans]|uniref:Tail specific protease domain-containing protein n=1 Tax=Panacibacter ginsenosidivorans TaxID=1813871 RepID=A0A5B8VDE2_9BACT|nr:S41 family peptidase [Panacibacter ginsenosidivorans]QEC69484.1 hypothetical protein FRZ67_20065 [Panacibacter ginsenosidivorans]